MGSKQSQPLVERGQWHHVDQMVHVGKANLKSSNRIYRGLFEIYCNYDNYYVLLHNKKVVGYIIAIYILVENSAQDDHDGVIHKYMMENNLLKLPIIVSFAVDQKYRQQGYGKQLINAVASGRKHIALQVRESNTPAITLYEKMGFIKHPDKLKAYYNDDGVLEDAFFMYLSHG